MPWCEIPPENLAHIGLFGYDILFEDDGFIWAHGPLGRTYIEKAKPILWFEDLGEAAQAGAISVVKTD